MIQPTPTELLNVTLQAAQAGAEALRERATGPRQVTIKGYRDVVTDADFASQQAILSVIRAAYPDQAILSEESHEAKHPELWRIHEGGWWIIDPLDGTTNFQIGMPTYCVSVAVAWGAELQAGALVDPNRNMTFAAARGLGATLNGQPIRISERDELIQAIGSCDWPRPPDQRTRAFKLATRLGDSCRTFRSVGSAALGIAYVAAGWHDLYIHEHIQPWDCAAAALIVREAGGVVTRHDGGEWGILNPDLIATTPHLKEQALDLVQGVAV